MQIKKSEIPVARNMAGSPSVSLRNNGQISFNKTASAAFNGMKFATLDWDDKTRQLKVTAVSKAPKGLGPEDLFGLNKNDKAQATYFAGSGVLKILEYDYRKAGNQSYPVTINGNTASFSVPDEDNLPKAKPVVARKKKGEAAGATAGTGTGVAAAGMGKSNGGNTAQLEEVE